MPKEMKRTPEGRPGKTRRYGRSSPERFRGKRKSPPAARLKVEAEPVLKSVFARIGTPSQTSFVPDRFQLEALESVKRTDCLVIAPTGTGKTWIAEQAIRAVFNAGGRCWYASPLKALSNARWVEFCEQFESCNVGILTGDTKENAEAAIIVGTTEILRNQLYDVMHSGSNLECDLVILDEAHYLGDRDRGVVWEEILIYLPPRINVLLLSATIGNGDELAHWLSSVRGKECVVVREEKRPVPLYPLFLHPSGRIMPYLEKDRLYSRVREYLEQGRQQGRRERSLPPRFGEIIRALETFNLLPAIFFLKSRSECNGAVATCRGVPPREGDELFFSDLEALLGKFPYLRNHKQLEYLMEARVAAHHGGQLPAWKFLVETMMKRGHLRAIFATSTVAAGVNYPARTIVLFNSDLYNGAEFSPLSGTEFHQMAGRAGRRGQDKIGFMLAVPGRFMDLLHMKKLLFKKPDDIVSQIRNDFSMILNLLLSQTPDDIRSIFEKSLAAYQQTRRKRAAAQERDLWEDFQRHLSFLKEEGFVDDTERLTETGGWASKLRLDHPLLIAECLRKEAFPTQDEKLLAAMVALFVYDGDQEIEVTQKVARRLTAAYQRVNATIRPLAKRMAAGGFPVNRLYLWTCSVIYDWARGEDWDELVQKMGIADGDLAMLVLRTADNLKQIASLTETHPETAALAGKAREAILREPVVFGEWGDASPGSPFVP